MLTRLYCRVVSWMKSDDGATAVEYGLIVALIAAVIITAVSLLGTNIAAKFNSVAGAVGSAGSGSGSSGP